MVAAQPSPIFQTDDSGEPIRCPKCTGDAAKRIYPTRMSLSGHISRIHGMTKAQRSAIASKRVATIAARKKQSQRKAQAIAKAKAHTTLPALGPRPRIKPKPPLPLPGTPEFDVLRGFPLPSELSSGSGSRKEPTLREALDYLEGKRQFLNEVIEDFKRFLGEPK